MKVFFDTNVYVAEALLGATAEELVAATERASWRIFVSDYVLAEVERVLVEQLGSTKRFAFLTCRRIARRSIPITPGSSRHGVPDDVNDTPILRAALAAGADYLVTNDKRLLALNPYESLRIVSMSEYRDILVTNGMIRDEP